MSRKANCWDNAVIESFFSHLKVEYPCFFPTIKIDSLEQNLKQYINYYNEKRSQYKLGLLSPKSYLLNYLKAVWFRFIHFFSTDLTFKKCIFYSFVRIFLLSIYWGLDHCDESSKIIKFCCDPILLTIFQLWKTFVCLEKFSIYLYVIFHQKPSFKSYLTYPLKF